MNIKLSQNNGKSSNQGREEPQGIKRKMDQETNLTIRRNLWPSTAHTSFPQAPRPIIEMFADAMTYRYEERQKKVILVEEFYKQGANDCLEKIRFKAALLEVEGETIHNLILEIKKLYKKLKAEKSEYEVFFLSIGEDVVNDKEKEKNKMKIQKFHQAIEDILSKILDLKNKYETLIIRQEVLLLELIAFKNAGFKTEAEFQEMDRLINIVQGRIMEGRTFVEFEYTKLMVYG